MTACTVLVDDGNPCGESPIWDVATGRLYWTDCAGRLFAYDWSVRERSVVLRDFVVNGAALHDEGGFTFVNGAGVWQWDGRNTPEPIVERCGRDPLQLNDCAADPEGRLIAGFVLLQAIGGVSAREAVRRRSRRHGARARRRIPPCQRPGMVARYEDLVLRGLGRPDDLRLWL